MAAILTDFGFDVQLTQATWDNGVDIIAHIKNSLSDLLIYVECKRYPRDRLVGVDVVRQLYGVHQIHRPNKSIVVTTSFFTKPAQELRKCFLNEMDFKDYSNLKLWLERYR